MKAASFQFFAKRRCKKDDHRTDHGSAAVDFGNGEHGKDVFVCALQGQCEDLRRGHAGKLSIGKGRDLRCV